MSTIKCPECKLVNWASESICKRCGLAFRPMDPITEAVIPEETPVKTAAREIPVLANEPSAFPPSNPAGSTVVGTEPAYHYYQPDAPKQKFGLAVFSMIAGIIGMPPFSTIGGAVIGGILAIGFGVTGFVVGLSLVFAIIPVGLISGIVSLRRANHRSHEYGGKGFAVAGIVCSSIAMVAIPVIAAIAIPNLLASRRAANEGAAVSTMRKLASAEDIFMKDLGKGTCGDLKVMAGVSLIELTLEKGEKSGYRYTVVNYPAGGCEIHGTPISVSTGNRSFYYSTNDGVVRAAAKEGIKVDEYDPVIEDPYSKNDDLPSKIALQKGR